jgi:glycosyltransferase involved in cell wall biosynthesis
MNNPLVSIVIPCYNSEKFLTFCIESLINQTYTNIEIIFINDASTDNSFELLSSYKSKDKRIKILNNEINKGLGYSRQKGLNSSSGLYICQIDSDDYLEKNYVEVLLNEFLKDPCLDIVSCNTKFIKEKCISLVSNFTQKDLDNYSKLKIDSDFFKLSKIMNLSESWAKMYKKVFIEKNNCFYLESPRILGSDFLFNHILFTKQPKFKVIYDFLYNYVVSENSSVRKNRSNVLSDFLVIHQKIIESLNNTNKKILNQIYFLFLSLFQQYLFTENFTGDKSEKFIVDFFKKFEKHNNKPNLNEIIYANIPKGLKLFALLILFRSKIMLKIYFFFYNNFRKRKL